MLLDVFAQWQPLQQRVNPSPPPPLALREQDTFLLWILTHSSRKARGKADRHPHKHLTVCLGFA